MSYNINKYKMLRFDLWSGFLEWELPMKDLVKYSDGFVKDNNIPIDTDINLNVGTRVIHDEAELEVYFTAYVDKTEEEIKEEIESIERIKNSNEESFKNDRYKTYLKLKKEFEGEENA